MDDEVQVLNAHTNRWEKVAGRENVPVIELCFDDGVLIRYIKFFSSYDSEGYYVDDLDYDDCDNVDTPRFTPEQEEKLRKRIMKDFGEAVLRQLPPKL